VLIIGIFRRDTRRSAGGTPHKGGCRRIAYLDSLIRIQTQGLTTKENWKKFKNVLKIVGNKKEEGSGKWQMVKIGLGPRRSRFVSLLILLSSLILCISISAPAKLNQ
jgi:hypothetical protein